MSVFLALVKLIVFWGTLFICSFPSTNSFPSSSSKYSPYSSQKKYFNANSHFLKMMTSTEMPPADLTPAVDKYARLPSSSKENSKIVEHNEYLLSAKGPSPAGPEPFGLVGDELQPLSDYVKELVASENPVLTMAASHFFDQVSFQIFLFFLRENHYPFHNF
jgi:hypothetical protein